MIVGCYKTNGEVLVLPLEQLAEKLEISEYMIKQCMESKARIPGMVFVKLPPGTTQRG